MTTAAIELPPKLVPVFTGEARYRGAYGGRGSGKSRSFARMAAVWGYRHGMAGRSGVILCAREFMNSLQDSSLQELKTVISETDFLADYYETGENFIRSHDGRISFTFAGLRRSLASLKSMSSILLAFVEEAEYVSEAAWRKLIPTIREPGSEIWLVWNPEAKGSATDLRFRQDPPDGANIVKLNYRDNPWFPEELERERIADRDKRPHVYGHIWEGEYLEAAEGAYFSADLLAAQKEGRIGKVHADPLMRKRVFVDIGGTGAKADAFAMWVAQFVGHEIRVLDYYEAVGQPLATHVAWLHERGYAPNMTDVFLPHDGATNDRIHDVSFESAFRAAGYHVTVIPNQGKGAAKARIEASRRAFPAMWFNEDTTEGGRDALAWYHEKRDEVRNIGLGPEHDWCLAAGTAVLTDRGWVPIEDIRRGEMIITPRGRREVIRSGIVRRTREWVNVRGIRSTPEHRFFTSRGLVEAGDLSPRDELWTRGTLGLKCLAYSSAILRSGFKAAIISATPEGSAGGDVRFSCIGWSMRLFTAKFRKATRSIMSTEILSTIIRTISKPFQNTIIEACTNPRLATLAFVGCAGESSGVTRSSARDVALNARGPITRVWSESAEPAYNLTIDVDECYFVQGEDGAAYLVSNSSHGADAFGLMGVVHASRRPSNGIPRKRRREPSGWAA